MDADAPLDEDPVVNVIYRGIKEPIRLCIDNGHERAGLQLIYAAIDVFSRLDLPESENAATRKHYGAWCDRYLKLDVQSKIKGLEWFAARSALLHNYTAESNLSREGKVRKIGYYSGEGPNVVFQPKKSQTLVLVRIEGLVDAFFAGINLFVVDLFSRHDHALLEQRFDELFHTYR